MIAHESHVRLPRKIWIRKSKEQFLWKNAEIQLNPLTKLNKCTESTCILWRRSCDPIITLINLILRIKIESKSWPKTLTLSLSKQRLEARGEKDLSTKREGVAGGGHELLVGHYDPDGAHHVHRPGADVRHRRRFLSFLHFFFFKKIFFRRK